MFSVDFVQFKTYWQVVRSCFLRVQMVKESHLSEMQANKLFQGLCSSLVIETSNRAVLNPALPCTSAGLSYIIHIISFKPLIKRRILTLLLLNGDTKKVIRTTEINCVGGGYFVCILESFF